MADTNTDNSQSAGIDLSQFYQVFFEEAGENLDNMEQLLLGLDITQADDEELNAIFRCAHSIKGGAATFGFSDVAELTHQMETLLDKLRRHELAPNASMVDVLLASGDALKAQLARHQGNGGDAIDTAELLVNIRALVAGETTVAVVSAPVAPAPVAAAPVVQAAPAAAAPAKGKRTVELRVGPLTNLSQADELRDLFKEIEGLGTIEDLPADGDPAVRRFKVETASAESDLMDLFTFHVAREQVVFLPWAAAGVDTDVGLHELAPAGGPDEPGYGFFDNAPGAPLAASAPVDSPSAPAAPPGSPAGPKPAPKVEQPRAC